MWWFFNWFSDYLARVFIEVLKCGRVPRHMAIILDGNRRYAKRRNKNSGYGHKKGGDTLKTIAKWSRIIGIKELTVYAFSIENFKRSKEEVEEVLDLIEKIFIEAVETYDDTHVRLVGNLDLIPEELRKSLSKYTLQSDGDKDYVINLAVAYTARDEITNAINLMNEGVKNGHLILDDIDEHLLNQCLYVQSQPDILLRTSGEKRFSDFLLWQIKSTQVNFIKTLWPDFDVWMLLACVFKYQADLKYIAFASDVKPREENPRKIFFLNRLRNNRLRTLQEYANS